MSKSARRKALDRAAREMDVSHPGALSHFRDASRRIGSVYHDRRRKEYDPERDDFENATDTPSDYEGDRYGGGGGY